MRLLQRYILSELLKVFAFLLCGFTVLLVFVGVFREVSQSGLGPFQALQILPFIVPSLLPFTIPATLLLTICVVFGRLSADHEITAAKAAGINALSLLAPALALGAVLSVCSLLLSDRVIPWAVANIQKTISAAMEDIFLDMLRSRGQVVDEDQGFSITVVKVDGRKLVRPTFHYGPKGRKPVTVQAQEATIRFDLEKHEAILELVRGHIDMPGQRRVWFEKEIQRFPLPYEAKPPKPRHQSVRKISRTLDRVGGNLEASRRQRDLQTVLALSIGNYDDLLAKPMFEVERRAKYEEKELRKLRTEIHSRFALSTSCFFFALVGAPFAILQGRRQFLTSFFLCFLPILVIYYPIAFLTINLAKAGNIPPWTLWSGNAILLVAGSHILRKVLKH